jgi:hypothetical protein
MYKVGAPRARLTSVSDAPQTTFRLSYHPTPTTALRNRGRPFRDKGVTDG